MSETATTKNVPLPPLPVITPESQPFWDSARERKLRLQRCNDCDAFFYPPSTICPRCWGSELEWAPVKGTGTVFSFVVYRRLYNRAYADLMPYAVAAIELTEGPRLISRMVNVNVEDISCDMPVRVVYQDVTDTITLPLFEPAGGL